MFATSESTPEVDQPGHDLSIVETLWKLPDLHHKPSDLDFWLKQVSHPMHVMFHPTEVVIVYADYLSVFLVYSCSNKWDDIHICASAGA